MWFSGAFGLGYEKGGQTVWILAANPLPGLVKVHANCNLQTRRFHFLEYPDFPVVLSLSAFSFSIAWRWWWSEDVYDRLECECDLWCLCSVDFTDRMEERASRGLLPYLHPEVWPVEVHIDKDKRPESVTSRTLILDCQSLLLPVNLRPPSLHNSQPEWNVSNFIISIAKFLIEI